MGPHGCHGHGVSKEKDEYNSRLNAEADVYEVPSLVPDSILNTLYPLILCNPHYNSAERLSNVPKISQLVNDRTGSHFQVCLTPESMLLIIRLSCVPGTEAP